MIITQDHLKLLKNLYIEFYEDVNYGSISSDSKRPFGNSDVLYDIAEILEWEVDEELTDEQESRAAQLFADLAIVLQICLVNQSFETGEFKLSNKYDTRSWVRVIH